MRLRRLGVVAAALALAACSDSNDTTADTTAAPATVTEPPSTTAAVDEGELAQSALLTVDDLPAGWTEAPTDDNDEQDAENIQRISECSGLDAELIGDRVLGDTKAKSPEFSSPDQLASVKQTLGLAPDEATASAAIAAIGDDKLAPCYEEAMRTSFEEAAVTTDPAESLPDGMTLTDVTMERIDPPVAVDADDAVWYSTKATLDYQGQSVDIYLDLLFTRTGRVLSQIEFDGTTQAFPEELYAPTVTAAHEKIDAIATA
jgi:hypothetical protein